MTSMPETRLQRQIQDILKREGAFVFKVHGSEYMMAGLPDLVVCYRGLFIGLEVKMQEGHQSARQIYVESQIRDAGGISLVVRSVRDVLAILARVDAQLDAAQR
jgi:Holliday junction resolvase